MKRRTPPVCPVCGEDVPPRAQACPECGACHESGWKAEADVYDGLDLPDEAWEEDDEPDRSSAGRRKSAPGMSPFWRIAALVVLAATFWGLWRWLFAAGRARWW
jgi:hypothetical protein